MKVLSIVVVPWGLRPDYRVLVLPVPRGLPGVDLLFNLYAWPWGCN